MLERLAGACIRAFFVALLVAMPSLPLPNSVSDATALIILLAIVAGAMTFIEYISEFPSVVEFRFAAPFNRLRFGSIFVTVLLLAVLLRAQSYPGQFGQLVSGVAHLLGGWLDFPYSPVRLLVLSMPNDTPVELRVFLRDAAALTYSVAALSAILLVFQIKVLNWPARNGAFNVWVNLPMFDPTKGDVLTRLNRDGYVNAMVGFVLPFLLPVIVKVTGFWGDYSILQGPQVVIWACVIWACLPTNMLMRGIAIGRVAEMISEKRRRAYAEAREHGAQAI